MLHAKLLIDCFCDSTEYNLSDVEFSENYVVNQLFLVDHKGV